MARPCGSVEVARRFRAGVLLACLLLCRMAGRAQADAVRAEVELMVPVLQRLQVEPPVLNFPPVTSTDLQAGFLDLGQPIELSVWSNTAWELDVRQAVVDGKQAAGAAPMKLSWSTEGIAYTPLAEDWAAVAGGEAGSAPARVLLRLRLPLGWIETRPGVYEPRIEYRVRPREN
jgi:hypothetical protein